MFVDVVGPDQDLYCLKDQVSLFFSLCLTRCICLANLVVEDLVLTRHNTNSIFFG